MKYNGVNRKTEIYIYSKINFSADLWTIKFIYLILYENSFLRRKKEEVNFVVHKGMNILKIKVKWKLYLLL